MDSILRLFIWFLLAGYVIYLTVGYFEDVSLFKIVNSGKKIILSKRLGSRIIIHNIGTSIVLYSSRYFEIKTLDEVHKAIRFYGLARKCRYMTLVDTRQENQIVDIVKGTCALYSQEVKGATLYKGGCVLDSQEVKDVTLVYTARSPQCYLIIHLATAFLGAIVISLVN